MKGIYLGLEALGTKSDAASLFDKTIAYYEAMEQFSDAVHEFSKITAAYESVCSINACIKKYGVTQSLEALFGENFRSTASMEEETEAAKQGLGAKIKAMFKKLLDAIKNLWTKFSNFIKGMFTKIKSIKFKNPFSFKKKNGETVEVKSQADQDKQAAALESDSQKKLKAMQALEAEIKAEYEKAGGGKQGAVEKKATVTVANEGRFAELNKKLEEAQKDYKGSVEECKAFTESAERAAKMLKHTKDDKTVSSIKEADHNVDEDGLSGGENLR